MKINPTGEGEGLPDEQQVSQEKQVAANESELAKLRQDSPTLAQLLEATQKRPPGPGSTSRNLIQKTPGSPMPWIGPLQPDDRAQIMAVLTQIVPNDFAGYRLMPLYLALCAVEDTAKLEMAIDISVASRATRARLGESLVALLKSSGHDPQFTPGSPVMAQILNAVQQSPDLSLHLAVDRLVDSIQQVRNIFFAPANQRARRSPVVVTQDDELLQNVLILGLREGCSLDQVDALTLAIRQAGMPDMLVQTCREIALARKLEGEGSSLRAHYRLPPSDDT